MYLLANFMPLSSSALFSFVAEPQREFPPVISNAFFISFIELFSSRISVSLFVFISLGNFSYVHYFYPWAYLSPFVRFLIACQVSFWHYFEFSTCLITILCDFKMGFWIIALSFLWFHVTVFFLMINELLLSQCIWNNKYHFYLCKSLFILILIITYW